ncbi:MAG: hypothetical protein IJ548_06155 [Paludibacteraceae bacterium]|nr:hypothetical protein [Paludibacteraceae bacterium]MBQ8714480.1 hypothetical protein [Prevotella sp.]
MSELIGHPVIGVSLEPTGCGGGGAVEGYPRERLSLRGVDRAVNALRAGDLYQSLAVQVEGV